MGKSQNTQWRKVNTEGRRRNTQKRKVKTEPLSEGKTHSGEKSTQRGEKELAEEKSQNRGGRRNLQTIKYRFDCQIFGLESRQFKL